MMKAHTDYLSRAVSELDLQRNVLTCLLEYWDNADRDEERQLVIEGILFTLESGLSRVADMLDYEEKARIEGEEKCAILISSAK